MIFEIMSSMLVEGLRVIMQGLTLVGHLSDTCLTPI